MIALKYTFFFLSSFLLFSGIQARIILLIPEFEDLIRGPCKAVAIGRGPVCFWNCGNNTSIPPRCKDALPKIKFNTSSDKDLIFCSQNSGKCLALNPKLAYAESYHVKDHSIIVRFIACLSFAFTVLTLATYCFKSLRRRRITEEIIIWNTLCWMIASIGWIVQFFFGPGKKIFIMDFGVYQHQLELGRYICGISFLLIYLFSMAGVVWFVILTYAWYSGLPERVEHDDFLQKEKYFHICAWCIPLLLTVTMMARTQVVHDWSIFYRVSNIDIGFVLANIAYLIGGYFLAVSLRNAYNGMLNSNEDELRKNFRRMMLQRGFIAICLVMVCYINFSCQAHEYNNRQEWNESFQDYVQCLAARNDTPSYTKCVLKSKPNVFVFVIHMLSLLMLGNMVTAFIWNKSFLGIFKYYFCGICANCCDGLKSDFIPPPSPPQHQRSPPNSRKSSIDVKYNDIPPVILQSSRKPASLCLSDAADHVLFLV